VSADQLAQWRTRMAAGGAELKEGVERTAAAASGGSSEALYLMALLAASGIGMPQDLKASLQHLQRAAEAGHRPAQTDLAALVGNWRLVGEISAGKIPRAESWQQLRAAIDVAAWLSIPPGRIFSEEPRIAAVRHYLSLQTCDWLIRLGRPHLKEAEIYDSESGALRGDRSRTNTAAPLGLEQMDMVVAFVRARISTLANVSIAGLETSQVLHYQVGQEFTAHCDYLDVSNPGHAQDVARHGQRALTVLIYLNDDYSGGDTSFPTLGRSFNITMFLGDSGSQLFQTFDVQVNGAGADGATTRKRNAGASHTSHQWTQHQGGSTHGLHQLIGSFRIDQVAAAHGGAVRGASIAQLHFRAHGDKQVALRLYVADVRDVFQDHWLFGEDGSRHRGQSGIFCATHAY